MPAHFGETVFDPHANAYYHDIATLVYSYTTHGGGLANYLPEGFELIKAELIIQYQQCRQVERMAGSYFNLVTVAPLCVSTANMTG